MSYAEFLIFFLILPSVVLITLGWLGQKRGFWPGLHWHHHWQGVSILAVIAFVWTTPWDNFLIARGVWDSPSDRIFARIFYVPIEEYAFFVLMPIFNGALLFLLLGWGGATPSTWRTPQRGLRIAAVFLALVLIGGGVFALGFTKGTYLGLILVWFTPPLLIQWLFDPGALVRGRRIVVGGTLLPLIYFGLADQYAIGKGIWIISPTSIIGVGLPDLPLEELLFFAITSLLIAQGIVLWHSLGRRSSSP